MYIIWFCANTMLFWSLWLYSIFWRHRAWFLQLCFSFSRLSWIFMISFWFHTNCKIFCSDSKCHWWFDKDCVEYVHCCGMYCHFHNIDSSNPRTWYIFLSASVIFDLFHQYLIFLEYKSFASLGGFISSYFIFWCDGK